MAGANVFTSRARPVLEILQRRESVLSVYTAEESSELNGDGYQLQRKLMVSVEGMAGGGDDLDDRLDDFAAQVEAQIDADPALRGLLQEPLVLASTTSEITARGHQQMGAFRLDYECAYLTSRYPVDADAPPVPSVLAVAGRPVQNGYLAPGNPWGDLAAEISGPAAPVESVCGETGCDLLAWGGEQ